MRGYARAWSVAPVGEWRRWATTSAVYGVASLVQPWRARFSVNPEIWLPQGVAQRRASAPHAACAPPRSLTPAGQIDVAINLRSPPRCFSCMSRAEVIPSEPQEDAAMGVPEFTVDVFQNEYLPAGSAKSMPS